MPAILFDLDGVIVDTEPSYSIFWGEMGRKYDVGIEDFADIIKGTTLTQILDRYFPAAAIQQEVVAQLVQYELQMQYELFDGVEEFLQQLADAHIPCAIVTSSNQDKMHNLWSQHPRLRQYFEAVITDEDVTHSKPDPEPYLTAARRLGVEPQDTCVFEDSINGLISGRRAGAMVVALDTTNPRSALADKADIIISRLDEITPETIVTMLVNRRNTAQK